MPFGVTAELKFSETDHWEVTVLGAERDATSIVLRENQFNDSPRDGHQFYLVTVGVKYLGTGSTTFIAGSRLKALGNGGVVYTTFGNNCGVIPDEFPYSELFTNGQLEGSECWEIASADVESLVMIVESDSSTAERAWFALPEVSNSTLPTLEATSVVQPNPTPTAIPTPTPEPTPTPRPVAEGRATPEEVDAKRLEMLALINDKREDAGLEPIVLDGNIAAQIHADGGLDGCHGSHWSLDGLKPYHRYSLAGGYQRTFTHLRWSGVCDTASDGRNSTDIDKEIAQALDDNSDMVIDPTFATVSIGLAWDKYNSRIVQRFARDYVDFDQLPTIHGNGLISMSGTIKEGLDYTDARDLAVIIYYDPTPYALTVGQVSRTSCVRFGPVAALLRSPTYALYYPQDFFSVKRDYCPDPYEVPSDAPAPENHDEAKALWDASQEAHEGAETYNEVVEWLTARKFLANSSRDRTFKVEAALGGQIAMRGAGVYTVLVRLYDEPSDAWRSLSVYSVFHKVTPPDTYTPR